MLKLFQEELGILSIPELPMYDAGSPESQQATLGLPSSSTPTAWIDTYYPYLDTPEDRSLEILDAHGVPVWTADLVEDGDPLDKDASRNRDSVHAWHGFSFHGTAEGQVRHGRLLN